MSLNVVCTFPSNVRTTPLEMPRTLSSKGNGMGAGSEGER